MNFPPACCSHQLQLRNENKCMYFIKDNDDWPCHLHWPMKRSPPNKEIFFATQSRIIQIILGNSWNVWIFCRYLHCIYIYHILYFFSYFFQWCWRVWRTVRWGDRRVVGPDYAIALRWCVRFCTILNICFQRQLTTWIKCAGEVKLDLKDWEYLSFQMNVLANFELIVDLVLFWPFVRSPENRKKWE